MKCGRRNPYTKTPSSHKTRKEGSTDAGDDGSPARPHPSLCGEAGSLRNRDEHNRTGILTPGIASLPPSLAVAVGVCSLLQWRNRPRVSRGSLTRDRVATDSRSVFFKERVGDKSARDAFQGKTTRSRRYRILRRGIFSDRNAESLSALQSWRDRRLEPIQRSGATTTGPSTVASPPLRNPRPRSARRAPVRASAGSSGTPVCSRACAARWRPQTCRPPCCRRAGVAS